MFFDVSNVFGGLETAKDLRRIENLLEMNPVDDKNIYVLVAKYVWNGIREVNIPRYFYELYQQIRNMLSFKSIV
jgi:hypothetical protein